MGSLEGPSGQRVLLKAHLLIGRSPGCDIVLDSRRISGQHAALQWTGRGWSLRDLGSRNGTWVDGRRLKPGEDTILVAGSRLQFADLDGWSLSSIDPPRAIAEPLDGGDIIIAQGNLIALPDDDSPTVCVLPDAEGWVIEHQDTGEVVPARDGQLITVQQRPWRLHLPVAVAETWDVSGAMTLHNVALDFVVSRDEEHVELTIRHASRAIPLKPRSHHYTLLTLARARLEDRGNALPDLEEGWLHREQLERMLALDSNALYQHIYRARRQFAGAGVTGAESIIERRAAAGQLRLGVAALNVKRL